LFFFWLRDCRPDIFFIRRRNRGYFLKKKMPRNFGFSIEKMRRSTITQAPTAAAAAAPTHRLPIVLPLSATFQLPPLDRKGAQCLAAIAKEQESSASPFSSALGEIRAGHKASVRPCTLTC
jgi:hypothetical protein